MSQGSSVAVPARHAGRGEGGSAGAAVWSLALLWALGVVFAVHALDFAGSVPDFVRASGGGELLDTRPSFSPEEIYRRLAEYGPAGRANYARRNLSVDVILPLSLLPLLYLLVRDAARRLAVGGAARTTLLALPLVYLAFDLAENAAVLALLARFPDRLPGVAAALPYLTTVKRAGVMLSLVIPLLSFAVAHLRAELRREG